MNPTPEQWTLIMTAAAGLLAAIGYLIRSFAKARLLDVEARAKVAVIEAENEKRETETDGALIKSHTETLTDMRAELRVVRREKENAEKERDDYKLQWSNTQTMLEARNEEKNEVIAQRDDWKRKAENLQAKLDFCIDKDPSMRSLLDITKDKDHE